jgi:hypothetical protein
VSYDSIEKNTKLSAETLAFLRLGCISTSVTGLILKCPADALVTRQILSARQMRMAKENALDFPDESTILI